MISSHPKSDEQWKIDSAVDTLVEAERIKNDKKMFPKVLKAFKRKLDELAKTALEVKVAKKQAEIRAKSGN